jgi:hypothetical protein
VLAPGQLELTRQHFIQHRSLIRNLLPQALHAIELRTPEYTFKPGTWFSRGMGGGSGYGGGGTAGNTAAGGARRPVKREPIIRALELEPFEYEVRRSQCGGA